MSNPYFTGSGTHTGYGNLTVAESVELYFEMKRQVEARNLREAEELRAQILANRSDTPPPPAIPEPERKPISEPDITKWDRPYGFDFQAWRSLRQ